VKESGEMDTIIEISKNPERLYHLSSIGLEGVLIINDERKYIETEFSEFDIKDLESFTIEDGKVVLKNEEGEVFYFSSEQFECIKEFLL